MKFNKQNITILSIDRNPKYPKPITDMKGYIDIQIKNISFQSKGILVNYYKGKLVKRVLIPYSEELTIVLS